MLESQKSDEISGTLKLIGHDTVSITRSKHYNGYPVRSLAWVCPKCLRLWAMFEVGGLYNVCAAPCGNCPEAASEEYRPVPGSLINDWTGASRYDSAMLEALPRELVQRELFLTLNAYEELWNQ